MFLVMVLLVRLRLLVSGTLEAGGAGAGALRSTGAGAPAGFAQAIRSGALVLGGEAAADADVVGVADLVPILGHQGLHGEDKDVIAIRGGVAEEGGLRAGAGREQIEATVFGIG